MFDYLEFAYKHKIDCNVITMENDFGSVHDVPEETLKKMRERFFPHETVMERLRADFPH